MNALAYVEKNLQKQSYITDSIVLSSFCSSKNEYKHKVYISTNLLNIVIKGKKILYTKSSEIEVKQGEAFILPKGEYLMSEIIGEEKYECLLLFFDHEKARNLIANLPIQSSPKAEEAQNIFKFKLDEGMKNTIRGLNAYIESKPSYIEELVSLKLKELMYLILSSQMKENFIKFCQNLIKDKKDLKSFMENSYEQRLTIKEFSKLSGRSLSSFKREFYLIFGETPMRWIIKKRLEKAKFLIEKLNYDVGEAAILVGFKTHAHFSRVYKEAYLKSPSTK